MTGKFHSSESKERMSISKSESHGKAIVIDGVEYPSIKYAVRNIPIHRGTLKRRIESDKFPNYYKK